jgi:LPS export ABC transporter protein LptC
MKKLIVPLLLLLMLSFCSEEKIEPQSDNSADVAEMPSQESWNSEVTFTDEGKIQAVLFSDHLEMYDTKKVTLLQKIKINFYGRDQKISSMLTAKRGRVNDLTKDMYAIDSVVAVNDSGTVLRTEELMWRNKDKKIVTDKFVTINSPKENIQGYGFESDEHLNNYVIHNITYSSNLPDKNKK